MSTVAISSSGAAGVVASQAARERHIKECGQVVANFDSKNTNTEEMQEYAACVEYLYPSENWTKTETIEAFAFVVIVVGLLVFIAKFLD